MIYDTLTFSRSFKFQNSLFAQIFNTCSLLLSVRQQMPYASYMCLSKACYNTFSCPQVTDALDYLHQRNIIYRDLKSDNVLVWNLPAANDLDPVLPVLVKLADYGISKSVYPTGEAKGYGGTPPFIAPEILIHTGRDTYTEKVGCKHI